MPSPDLSHLNPEQLQAATHLEGPLLVLAGAGSGKTRVLTSRIVWLIEEVGVDPAGILALTFTNRAAGEMRERIRASLGREPAGLWMGTFHAVGVRILRREAQRLGWSPGFSIYDADDAEALTRRLLRDTLGLDPKRWAPRAVHGAISSARNELVGPDAYADSATDAFEKVVARVFPLYVQALRDANAFDFDDLLVRPVQLFREHPRVLERYRERFRFVLVDEYQDTNRAQYAFLRLLSEEHGNLFVVGDDDQSIYGWRGADLRNILEFEEDFPETGIVRLERNYRSTAVILEAANRVIELNVHRKGKTLRTEAAGGDPITLVQAADERDEASWIAGEVRSRRVDDPGLGLRDFVVLYRTNAQSRSLEEAMRGEGLPYRVIGGTRFYERREVRDALAYLRLVANPAADEAFLRVVNVPRRGIGDQSVSRLAEHAAARGIPLLRAAAGAESAEGLRGAAARSLAGLAALVGRYAALAAQGVALGEFTRELMLESGLVDALRAEGPEGRERIENIEELVSGAAELQRRLDGDDPELRDELAGLDPGTLRPIDVFLAHVALVADIDQHDPGVDAVSLMTLHNAKGLEFPVVFLSGLEDGLFPLARAYDEPADLEEERRLFYVGVTRAERKLYLTHAKRRRRGASWMDAAASPFLEAIPPELVEPRRTAALLERGSPFSRPWRRPSRSDRLYGAAPAWRPAPAQGDAADPTYQVDYSDTQEEPSLRKGARVRHPTFGAGTVAEVSGYGSDVKATVDFDSVGRKTVLLKYARLERDWE
jgi:DNA helicase II / ATP-dependent DNA helicase PcrA